MIEEGFLCADSIRNDELFCRAQKRKQSPRDVRDDIAWEANASVKIARAKTRIQDDMSPCDGTASPACRSGMPGTRSGVSSG